MQAIRILLLVASKALLAGCIVLVVRQHDFSGASLGSSLLILWVLLLLAYLLVSYFIEIRRRPGQVTLFNGLYPLTLTRKNLVSVAPGRPLLRFNPCTVLLRVKTTIPLHKFLILSDSAQGESRSALEALLRGRAGKA